MHYHIDMTTHNIAFGESGGWTGWSKSVTHKLIVNMVKARGIELTQTFNLPITGHADTYALALIHVPAPEDLTYHRDYGNITKVLKSKLKKNE